MKNNNIAVDDENLKLEQQKNKNNELRLKLFVAKAQLGYLKSEIERAQKRYDKEITYINELNNQIENSEKTRN